MKDALEALYEARRIERNAFDDNRHAALTLVYLSDTLRHAGRLEEAEVVAREALAMNTERLGLDSPRTREAEGALGRALAKRSGWAEAEPFLLRYAAALETKSGVEGDFREVALEIVRMYEAWGKPEKAKEWRAKLESANTAAAQAKK